MPVWYAAYSPMRPQRYIASPFNHGHSEAISGKSVHAPTLQMWEGRKKKTYQKQKCNLEAVLRGMTQLSNRLLVREWCLCVALPKPLMCMDTSLCGRSVPLMLNWTPEGDVGLWWDDGTLQPANQKKMWLCNKLLSSRITLLFYYFPVPASWPGCAVWKSQHSRTHIKQTLIRFIVGKSCPSRCLINKYVWTD